MNDTITNINKTSPETAVSKPIAIYGGPLFDGKGSVFEDGAVFVSNGKIVAVGSEESVFNIIPKTVDLEVYDTMGRVIFPGMINLHHHFYRTLAMGLQSFLPSTDVRKHFDQFWWKFDKCLDDEIVQLSALVGVLNSIRAGVTTIFDLHSSPVFVGGILENIASVIKRAEIEAVLSYEISERNGEDIFVRSIEENLNFIENHKQDACLHGMIGIQANSSLSEKALALLSGKMNADAGFHIHLGSEHDIRYCKNLNYKGPVDRLRAYDLINSKSLLVGGARLDQDEIDQIIKNEAVIVQTPNSNIHYPTDTIPLPASANLKTGIGTSGYSSNILESFRFEYNHYRQSGVENVPLLSFLEAQLQTNSDFAGRYFTGKPGVLEKGANADIVVFDYIPITPFQTDNYLQHLLFGMQNIPAQMVMTKGRFIYNNHTFLTLDEEIIIRESQKASRRLWKTFIK